jgi:hypothetical protein
MRKTELDPLTTGQQWRLRIALDRVMPPFSPPRYQAKATAHVRAWRLAPATFALGLTAFLALSAYAATGSANPVVWGQRVESTIHSVRQAPEAPAPPPPSTGSTTTQQAPKALPGPTTTKTAEPASQHPEGSDHERGAPPKPSGEDLTRNSPRPTHSPDPTPSPSDH